MHVCTLQALQIRTLFLFCCMSGDPQTYAIIGAAMEVHRALGCGFLERVYAEALCREFAARQISYAREVPLRVMYCGKSLVAPFRADIVCYGEIIVELKAVTTLAKVHSAQVINYLRASEISRGLLLNFGGTSLQYRRFVGPSYKGITSSV